MIGAIHKIPWKFSCYQCYVICFLWLFKTNHHRFSSIYLCLDFWLWSSTRLSCYVSSSPLLSSCYISTKNVYQVKHGKPQLPKRLEEKHILIMNNLDAGHYQPKKLFIAKTLATPNRIYLSLQSVSYPQQFKLLSN